MVCLSLQVTRDCRVTVDLDASGQTDTSDQLILSADDKDDVDKAVKEIERILEHCQQSVSVKKLPAQSETTYQKVVQRVNDVATGAQISLGGPADIRVIGTESEVEDILKALRELCGVVDEENQEGQAAAASQNQCPIMKLETDLWTYMQKNPEFSDDVRRLKEEMHVDVVEAVSDEQRDEGQVELVFSGPEDDVTAAMDKTVLLISRCRATTTIKSVPCPDNRIFTKVVKFLPAVNSKTSGLVTAVDGVVNITGNEEQQDVCRDKLAKLGLVIEDQPQCNTGVVTTVDVIPPLPPVTVLAEGEDVGPPGAEVPTTKEPVASRMEIPRPFDRSPLHGDNDRLSQLRAPSDDPVSGDVWRRRPDQVAATNTDLPGQTSAELPIPIEAPLWMFIENRRRQQLQELQEVYGVSVQSYQSEDGMLRIRLNAVSPDMLSCAVDALSQLLDQLSKTVSITAMEMNDRGEQLPREAVQLFQQMADDTDAIVEVKGSRIHVIGSSEGTAAWQQKMAAFMQQVLVSYTTKSA